MKTLFNILSITFLCLLPAAAAGQFSDPWLRTAPNGEGHWLVANEADVGRCLGAGYAIDYGLAEMATMWFYVHWPVARWGYASGWISHFGDLTYAEVEADVRFCVPISKQVSLGVGGSLNRIQTDDEWYAPHTWIAPSVCMQVRASKSVTLGAELRHTPWADFHPLATQLVIGYRPTLRVLTAVGLSIGRDARPWFHGTYRFSQAFYMGAGLIGNPTTVYLNLGMRRRSLMVEAGTMYHNVLGLSPRLTVGICI